MTVTKDTLVSEITSKDMNVALIFISYGINSMFIFSPDGMNMTIEEVACIHGVDSDELIESINGYLNSSK